MKNMTMAAVPLAATIAVTLVAAPSTGKAGRAAERAAASTSTMLSRPSPAGAKSEESVRQRIRDSKASTLRAALNLPRIKQDAGGIAGAAPDYATCFEAADGFVPGFLTGQNGWTWVPGFADNAQITTTSPLQGAQSVMITVGGTGLTGAISPAQIEQADGRYIGEVTINPTNVGGPDFLVNFGNVPAGGQDLAFIAGIDFSFTGDILIQSTGGAFVDTGCDWTSNQSRRIRVQANPGANTIDYFLDGVFLARGVFPFPANPTTINGVALFTDNFAGPGPDQVRYDCATHSSIRGGCISDINWDNTTNIDDLLAVIGSWGACPTGTAVCGGDVPCFSDIVPSGSTDIDDLLAVIGGWGPCPEPTGACCVGSSCSQQTATACATAGGVYNGAGSACGPLSCAGNDTCATAVDITSSIDGPAVVATNAGAGPVEGGGDPEIPGGGPSCQWQGNPLNTHNTVWFSFVAPAGGAVTIETCDSVAPFEDSILGLYSGACGGLTEVGCGEDECGAAFYSRIAATGLTPGATYYLVVANPGGGFDTPGQFNLRLFVPAPPASNDTPAGAIDITGNINGAAVNGDNSSATPVAGGGADPDLPPGSPSCHWIPNPTFEHNTVWYRFTAPAGGVVTLSLCTSVAPLQDADMVLYSGTPGSFVEVVCDDFGCQGNNPPYNPTITGAGVTPGQVYYVMVGNAGGWAGSIPGPFVLTITSP